jgi:type IV secretion system protein VirB1
MTVLTPAAAMALALQCVPPSVAPIMVAIAEHESGLDPVAIHRNANGTVDVGLTQVNSGNFTWLGLTLQTALDPCRNLAAGARVLLAKYNGKPPDTAKAAYATAVTARIRDLSTTPSAPPSSPPNPSVVYAKPAKHAGRNLVYGN